MIKGQILLFLKYLNSIENNTNKDIKDSKIRNIIFNTEFHKAFVEEKYIGKTDTTFKGYPISIDTDRYADFWGMCLESIK